MYCFFSTKSSFQSLTTFFDVNNEANFLKIDRDFITELETEVECESGEFWPTGKIFTNSKLVGIRFFSGPALFSLKYSLVEYLTHSNDEYLIQLQRVYQNIINPMKVIRNF